MHTSIDAKLILYFCGDGLATGVEYKKVFRFDTPQTKTNPIKTHNIIKNDLPAFKIHSFWGSDH